MDNINRLWKRLTDHFDQLAGRHVEGSAVASKVRAKQIRSIVETTPLMMLANLVTSGISFVILRETAAGLYLALWVSVVWFVAGLGLWDWYRRLRHLKIRHASARSIHHVAAHATLLGLLWGILVAIAYSSADPGGKLLLTAVAAGMAGAGCLVLYVVPLAMAGWLTTFSLGMAAGLISSGGDSDHTLLFLCLLYAVSLYRAGTSASKTFNENSASAELIKDQSATIQMLLSDFSESARDWLWETNHLGQLIRGRQQFVENAGLEYDGVGSGALAFWMNAQANAQTAARLRESFRSRVAFRNMQLETDGPNGRHWVNLSGKPVFDEDGQFTGFRGVASNVTELHKAEKQIAYLAFHDPLTGLENRQSFNASLEKAWQERVSRPGAVLYLDLDGFKAVNDQYGHAMGDKLLVEVADRLRAIVPSSDVIARLGGDEFAIIVRSARRSDSLVKLLERIVLRIGKPYRIAGVELRISVSIGAAHANAQIASSTDWLNHADLALYRMKEEGKAGFRFYEEAMDELVQRQRKLERDLKTAVEGRQLTVVYQPYVQSGSRRTAGFEALVRWDHPELGTIAPMEFIPLAERAGLIEQVGSFVLETASADAVLWPESLGLSVNLSPQQMQRSDVAARVFAILSKSGLAANRLELEITESSFLAQDDLVLENLRQLKGGGVSIALDDFGTGYSALSYLLRFPFDKLKIDKSFVMPALDGHAARDMLETIHSLAQALKLTITAEGVENEGQAALLEGMGCHYLQGFHFSRPIESERIAAYLLREQASLTGAKAEGFVREASHGAA